MKEKNVKKCDAIETALVFGLDRLGEKNEKWRAHCFSIENEQ